MNIKLADRLIELRKQNRLSQEALAEKLGLSRQAISKWERGESSPDTDNLIALAELYGISLDELLGNESVTKENQEVKKDKKENKLLKASPILFLVAIAVYVVGGIALGGKWWAVMWILFTLVLSFTLYSASKSVEKRGLKTLLTTVAVVLATVSVYVLLGMLFSLWNVAWIVFLLIPAYIYIAVLKK